MLTGIIGDDKDLIESEESKNLSSKNKPSTPQIPVSSTKTSSSYDSTSNNATQKSPPIHRRSPVQVFFFKILLLVYLIFLT